MKNRLFHDLKSDIEFFCLHKKAKYKFIYVFHPRLIPNLFLRLSLYLFERKIPLIPKILSSLNFLFFGIEISLTTQFGKGIFFPHTQGTVIGAKSIGDRVVIFQNVTLGAKYLDLDNKLSDRPLIGDDVTLGAGCKVLGGIKINSGTLVKANNVITKDI